MKLISGASLALALLATLSVSVRVLHAQAGTGSFAGSITDSASAHPVLQAQVQVVGTQRTAVSGPDGGFRISGLLPGRYDLRVIAIGFSSGFVRSALIEADQVTRVDVPLVASAFELAGIVVTSGSGVDRSSESAVSVAVVDQTELQQRNVSTLDQALPYVPGVLFNHTTLDIRGASGVAQGVGSRVLMMLDGHPLLTPDGGQINFYAIPLLDVDRTEVVKGAYSALYGSAALGGVINLITTPVPETPHTVVRGYAGAFDIPKEFKFTAQSLNYVGLQLQHSRHLGETGARLALGMENSDGYTQNGDLNRYYARLKLTSPAGQAHPWDAFLVGALNNEGDYFIWRSPDEPYEVRPQELGNWTHDGQVLAGATFTPLARQSETIRLSPTLLFAGSRNHFNDNHDWHNALRGGVNTQYLANLSSRNNLTAGVDANYTLVRSNFIGEPGIADLSLFGLDEWRLNPALRTSVGLRLDYHDTNVGASETQVNPTLGLVWNTTRWLNARASVSRGYRAPSATEQFVSTTQSGFIVVPNPDLRGETGWTEELGATVGFGPLSFDAALFQSNYQGFIGPGVVPGHFGQFQFQNLSSARVRGLDLSSHTAIWPGRVDLAASYLYLDTRNGDTGDPLPYRSRHSVTGSVDVLHGLVGVDVRWRSRVEEVLAYPLDTRTDITVVDLRLAYRVFGAVLMAKATNLLQAKYVDVQERTPGAPRSVQLTVVLGS